MAVSCTPNALSKASACYCFGDKKVEASVMIYLLAQIAGDASTPAALAKKAACYCFDPKTRDAVMLYLLCQAVNK